MSTTEIDMTGHLQLLLQYRDWKRTNCSEIFNNNTGMNKNLRDTNEILREIPFLTL